MDKLTIILLVILGIAGTVVVTALATFSWAIHLIDREEQQRFQEYRKYELRNGLIYEAGEGES